MNYRRTNPTGIDLVVDQIQRNIYDPLTASWGVIDLYDRVYRNQDHDGFSLQRYIGEGEYEDLMFSEGNKLFFVQGQSPKVVLGEAENSLWVVAALNLDQVKARTHRSDEEVHLDLVSEISKVVNLEDIEGIEYGLDNLKKIVVGGSVFANFKAGDIHPYHVFAVRLKVRYGVINNEC
ncbi:hypothetical protein [Robiginitalea biformata]|uniref:Uncharacterized protein n=1 Tax=Robiginitalea biformata (strain ATCC BAA-864 / DSM 15991 / KCTC 12146 / HTCC2501) TaxID=313596 RepID=A4CP60_ROBBH|nr:hypothetical protein [Robiginitalea biformata]EAR14677.1 hypothetical protein RB2501_01336 [Robiginitalea biformata HTCC2501]